MFNPKWELLKQNLVKRKNFVILWNIPVVLILVVFLFAIINSGNFPDWRLWLGFFALVFSFFGLGVPDAIFPESTAKKVLITVLSVWLFLFFVMVLGIILDILL